MKSAKPSARITYHANPFAFRSLERSIDEVFCICGSDIDTKYTLLTTLTQSTCDVGCGKNRFGIEKYKNRNVIAEKLLPFLVFHILFYCFVMTWVIVGLGNPDEEHVRTRHNAGRMAVEYFAKKNNLGEWKEDSKSKSFIVRGAIGKQLVVCVLPNTYMNKSGSAVAHFVKSVKAAEKLIVVYDELDMGFGNLKISFDRGSGGHRGVESIARAVKTKKFSRVRIGISRMNGKGEVQKPLGETDVEKYILGNFSSAEFADLKGLFKKTTDGIEAIVREGYERAMNSFNSNR